jgi:hypothetical protein
MAKERLRDVYSSTVEYTEEEILFFRAVEQYKKKYKRLFPSLREVLAIARSLGYRRVAEQQPLPEFFRQNNG